ncbi:MAG: tRNA uridine-5-carboxymethylaminomethyl(34) synthesis GTPase MnmE [Pseudomonadota bacterium]
MQTDDTIAAIATGAGKAGIGIVRVSGPAADQIASALVDRLPPPREARLRWLRDAYGDRLDRALIVRFPGPDSFTGEDVVEFQGHGGPLILEAILAAAVAAGARRAKPGEFTERAFFNDKIDLAQAEAIADLINSQTHAAARAAVRSMSGDFSAAVMALVEQVTRLRMYVEAAIDFPEEEIDSLDDVGLAREIDAVITAFEQLQRKVQAGRVLADGLNVVLLGAPNVGKSSLMNTLTGAATAIVTDIPGTTRDLIREAIDMQGVPLLLTDTAGLREASDVIEQEGIRRSRAALGEADHALVMIAANDPAAVEHANTLLGGLPESVSRTVVINKIDLVTPSDVSRLSSAIAPSSAVIAISATTESGIDALRDQLLRIAGVDHAQQTGSFSARRRHVELLADARAHVDTGIDQLRTQRAGELLAEELRLAQNLLGEITGQFSSDDLLGKIFGEFCIGK